MGFAFTAMATVGIALLFVLPGPGPLSGPPAGGTSLLNPDAANFAAKIKHVVIVMMENHAYDNYYGTYCTKLTKHCSTVGNGVPPNTCIPRIPGNKSAGCVKPFVLTPGNWSIKSQMPHSANSSVAAWNHGKMNGFFLAEKSSNDPFGHYNATSAPILWDLAEQYGLADNFFSSDLSYSLPNHWNLVAGQSPLAIQWQLIGAELNYRLANRTAYLGQANNTSTVEDLLHNSTVSWKWYDHSLGTNYTASIGNLTPGGTPAGNVFAYWNPLASKPESYGPWGAKHFVNNTQFYSDARAGALPSVSWIIPGGVDSDHPPASSALAQGWVASIVNAVESSPQWNSTALFVTWDEYGGFYDHVAPPFATGTNHTLGFRVPLLVVSPYARTNYIGHSLGYFDSLLRLVENRFSLPCLTAMDCNAPGLYQFFNFSQAPRPPMLFSTNISNAHYPMPIQTPSAPPEALPPYYAPDLYVTFPDGEGPDIC